MKYPLYSLEDIAQFRYMMDSPMPEHNINSNVRIFGDKAKKKENETDTKDKKKETNKTENDGNKKKKKKVDLMKWLEE